MAFKINDTVSWIGKIDWELRKFHGQQLSTYRGSSYNAYLIKDEKNVIIDSVWRPFAEEFIANLKKEIDFASIDYVVVNHAEPDHSGALPFIMDLVAPDTPIICTANGAKSIKGYYHKDWNFKIVKNGEKLSIGSRDLIFIEAPMLHWPDTMMTYLSGDNILFSNDVFGQHFACEGMYDDLVDNSELMYESIKYFANIVSPFNKKVLKKMQEFKEMNLPINLVCPAHGVIWRKNIETIINKYEVWASSYSENQVTLIYDTMYDSTRKMAEAIASGILIEKPDLNVKLFNSSKSDNSDIITEVFRSKAFLIGSPTYNNGILNSTAAILEEIKGIAPENKKAAVFGSYGWSPANIKIISEFLKEASIEVILDGAKSQWNPDTNALDKCVEFGKEFARQI